MLCCCWHDVERSNGETVRRKGQCPCAWSAQISSREIQEWRKQVKKTLESSSSDDELYQQLDEDGDHDTLRKTDSEEDGGYVQRGLR